MMSYMHNKCQSVVFKVLLRSSLEGATENYVTALESRDEIFPIPRRSFGDFWSNKQDTNKRASVLPPLLPFQS